MCLGRHHGMALTCERLITVGASAGRGKHEGVEGDPCNTSSMTGRKDEERLPQVLLDGSSHVKVHRGPGGQVRIVHVLLFPALRSSRTRSTRYIWAGSHQKTSECLCQWSRTAPQSNDITPHPPSTPAMPSSPVFSGLAANRQASFLESIPSPCPQGSASLKQSRRRLSSLATAL